MSLIPAFEIGVWNAWIFMVLLLVPYFLVPLNIIPKGREGGSSFVTEFNKTQKTAFFSLHILNLLMFIYSVFVPIKLGTVWFYVGLPVYLIGLIFYALVFVAFARTPPEKLVTGGIYHYSRNPMQLSIFLAVLGIGIATASWVFLLLAVLFTLMPLIYLKTEELHLLKFYGDTYRDYMNRTPRWIGIPKSG
jgi:protein-S-isoprenylcysteine O-methyltransferase Ste14